MDVHQTPHKSGVGECRTISEMKESNCPAGDRKKTISIMVSEQSSLGGGTG